VLPRIALRSWRAAHICAGGKTGEDSFCFASRGGQNRFGLAHLQVAVDVLRSEQGKATME